MLPGLMSVLSNAFGCNQVKVRNCTHSKVYTFKHKPDYTAQRISLCKKTVF